MSPRTRSMPMMLAMTAAAMTSFAASSAFGCPACAANGAGSSAALWYALAGIVIAPFVIGGIAFAVLRGLAEERGS